MAKGKRHQYKRVIVFVMRQSILRCMFSTDAAQFRVVQCNVQQNGGGGGWVGDGGANRCAEVL